jgi:hypothetical protein
MAIGAGTVAAGWGSAGSSRRWKRNPANSDERNIDHNNTLSRVTALPVERWRYNENTGLEAGDHIGPYAEDFRELFGIGDGSTINIIDALGVALSAIKGLAEKVERLEND